MFVTSYITGAAASKILGKARRVHMLISKAVGDSLADLEREHKLRQIKTGTGSKDKPVPGKWTTRTGELRKSFHIDWRPGQTSGAYGSDKERARHVEEGGEIKPRRGKYLAIPTENAPKKVWPRYVPGLHVHKSKRGNLLLVEGYGSSMRVMYLLVKKVKLPPRPALQRAVRATEDKRDKRFLDIVDKEMWGRN